MRDSIRSLIEDLDSDEFDIWNTAFSDAATVLERHSRGKYDAPEYEELFAGTQLLDLVLREDEYWEIVDTLVHHLKSAEDRSGSAAWAIGKTYNERVCDDLSEAAEKYCLAGNDNTVYQLIIAIENCGVEEYLPLIEKITSYPNLSKSAEYAGELLSNRKNLD